MILLHMGLQLQRLLFPHQLLFKKIVLKTGDAIYYFRVETIKLRMVVFVIAHCLASMCIIFHHIGLQQQGLTFPHQLLFKNVVLNTRDVIYF